MNSPTLCHAKDINRHFLHASCALVIVQFLGAKLLHKSNALNFCRYTLTGRPVFSQITLINGISDKLDLSAVMSNRQCDGADPKRLETM